MPSSPRALHPDRSVRDLFGAKLRSFRSAHRLSLEQLACEVLASRSHLSRIECADCPIPPELPPELDRFFATDGIFRELYALARHEVHPDKYRRRMELEEQALAIAEFGGTVVPGLVQTRRYARAQFRESLVRRTDEEIEKLVDARLARQEVLKADTPELSLVLDEAVLHRPVGGPEVQHEQLAFLLELADTRSSSLQVVPFSAGGHGLLGGTLTLWRLPGGRAAAYEESIDSGTLVESPEEVDLRQRAYDRLRSRSLSVAQSVQMIRGLREAG